MFCSQCGQSIESDSRFCRYCGGGQSPASTTDPIENGIDHETASFKTADSEDASSSKNRTGKMVATALVAIVVLLAAYGSLKAPGSGITTAANGVSNASALDNAADALEASADITAKDGNTGAGANWSYNSDEDKVRGGTAYYAATTSTNSIHQDAPYDSDTTMSMTVRRHPAFGTDVVLTISSGQMMCPSYEGCSGTVRFDNGPAQRISFNGPADSSSDTIFVRGAQSFISKLKKAKKVIIEKTLYEAGNPQFEFDVHGLKWAH